MCADLEKTDSVTTPAIVEGKSVYSEREAQSKGRHLK